MEAALTVTWCSRFEWWVVGEKRNGLVKTEGNKMEVVKVNRWEAGGGVENKTEREEFDLSMALGLECKKMKPWPSSLLSYSKKKKE